MSDHDLPATCQSRMYLGGHFALDGACARALPPTLARSHRGLTWTTTWSMFCRSQRPQPQVRGEANAATTDPCSPNLSAPQETARGGSFPAQTRSSVQRWQPRQGRAPLRWLGPPGPGGAAEQHGRDG
ncbi:hypothetical protein H310_08606 [Aphanomyces invadans]|uniref:Uncharacterized protein n=1 Tax=Aphanomyces invadans TaxID=157072 RepID=A0A024TWT2_9STRA|nr:hypothetical protein H310_08606 [Aphanomyces invadans]ETV98463.1 hypothetical protein H310_08606 [Aphanomyces invadans]|eukprot:XP_008872660.1 hypothetical protein H310_08606 [Aphanomyces invadans]